MSNSVLTVDMIAAKALALLDNNLVMAKTVDRTYEDEWNSNYNGYKVGDTISIRRPALYTVRSGEVAQVQNSVEGKTTLVVDSMKGVDLQFGNKEMTLDIDDFAERFLMSPMIQLANTVDRSLTGLYAQVPQWVGTPGQTIDSWADFAKGPQRMDEIAIPEGERRGILSPADRYGLAGAFAVNQVNPAGSIVSDAISAAKIPAPIANLETYASQNVQRLTVGTRVATAGAVNGSGQVTTYALTKDTNTQSFPVKSFAAGATIAAGEVFTIDDVYDVNPVTKQTLPYLKQFVVMEAKTLDGSGEGSITISPPLITSGAYQTVSAAPLDSAGMDFLGTASTAYTQNMLYHKRAFALAVVPLEMPAAAVVKSRKSYKGLSARLIQAYDATNNTEFWRFDILYGVKCVDPRLAVRLSGT